MKKRITTLLILINFCFSANAAYILIPMDRSQKNHLKSYGLAYWVLENGIEVNWLLNYRGGSFMFAYGQKMEIRILIVLRSKAKHIRLTLRDGTNTGI